MRTLQISDDVLLDSSEGRRVLTISNELAKMGHDVVLATAYRSEEHKIAVESQIDSRVELVWHEPLLRFRRFSYSPKLYDTLSKHSYDILHAHSYRHYGTYVGALIQRRKGTPYVLSPYGSVSHESTHTLRALYSIQDLLTRKYPMRQASRILANTEYEKNQIVTHGGDPEKIDLVYREVDTELFRKKSQNVFSNSKTLLFMGRVTPLKGIELAIDALPFTHEEVTLVVAGPTEDLNYLERLKSRVTELGLEDRVDFLGSIRYEDTPKYFSSALVLILPSIYENLGGVLLEAQACECPVITSGVGGTREVVLDGKTGIVLRERSPTEVANAVNLIADDKRLRESLGLQGRKYVEAGFSVEVYVKRIEDSYMQALAEAHTKAEAGGGLP